MSVSQRVKSVNPNNFCGAASNIVQSVPRGGIVLPPQVNTVGAQQKLRFADRNNEEDNDEWI